MRNSRTISRAQIYLSAILLVLFVSIQLVQIIHTHHCIAEYNDTEQSNERITAGFELCKLCDYYTHHQHEFIYFSESSPLSLSLLTSNEAKGRVVIRIYEFTWQGLTNKGPPFSVRI